jgi:hypothetical protein
MHALQALRQKFPVRQSFETLYTTGRLAIIEDLASIPLVNYDGQWP